MDFKQKSIELYSLILKDLMMETARLKPEAVKYISFCTGIIEELEIYEEVLENMTSKMDEKEKEVFLSFEQNLNDWFKGKDVSTYEQD